MMNIPPQTSLIFQLLSSGEFLSKNSFSSQKNLYEIASQFREELTAYFRPLGFELMAGDGFFYFSSPQTEKTSEEKLDQAIRFIEWLDFFKSYATEFGPGYVFTLEEIHEKCHKNAYLKRKLDQLSGRGGQGRVIDKIRQVVRMLEKQGLVELIHESDEKYHVLSAFSFLENWAHKIELV